MVDAGGWVDRWVANPFFQSTGGVAALWVMGASVIVTVRSVFCQFTGPTDNVVSSTGAAA